MGVLRRLFCGRQHRHLGTISLEVDAAAYRVPTDIALSAYPVFENEPAIHSARRFRSTDEESARLNSARVPSISMPMPFADGSALAALHDINLAARYCSHVVMLFGNGEWCAGETGAMLDETSLERLYGCPVERLESSQGPRFHPADPPAAAD